ncbi:MAG: hypothetical protein ABXS93_02235 [Sulfurimonas sp.]
MYLSSKKRGEDTDLSILYPITERGRCMDTLLYLGSLLILALLAFVFYQNNHSKLAIVVVLIGIYVVYSHETGHTAGEFSDKVMKSVEEDADDIAKNYRFDGEKLNKPME